MEDLPPHYTGFYTNPKGFEGGVGVYTFLL